MKNFWKKYHKWIILFVVISAAVCTCLIFYLGGYRCIRYPNISITWDQSAVIAEWFGAVATIIGVIVSGIAIVYAVSVPKKIAIQQNKIALFERKLKCYSTVCDIIACSNTAKYSPNSNGIFRSFYGTYGEYNENKNQNQTEITPILVNLNRQLPILRSGTFLYSSYDSNAASQMFFAAASLIEELKMGSLEEAVQQPLSGSANKARENFCSLCDEFNEKYLKSMEAELKLDSLSAEHFL